MGSMRTWKEIRAQEEERRTGQPRENAGPDPLLQKDFEAQAQVFLNTARTRPEDRFRRPAAFVEAVESLNRYLLWGGAALALALGFSWALRGRSAAQPALPDPPWGLWDVAKVSALWAAGAQAAPHEAVLSLNPARPFAVPGDWIAEIFIAILLVGATTHIVVAERGGHLRDLGIRGKFFGGVGLGLIAFLVVQPFLQLIVLLEERAARSGRIPDIPVQQFIQVIAKTRSGSVLALAAIVAVVAAPVSEELLFRGFLQPALARWTGRWLAIVLSAAFFAAAHMDLYAMPPLLVLGIALACVYDRTRSLAAPHGAPHGFQRHDAAFRLRVPRPCDRTARAALEMERSTVFAETAVQLKRIERGVAEIFPHEDLVSKLEKSRRENRPLRIKLGIDPTSSDIHLGHAVPLNKLQALPGPRPPGRPDHRRLHRHGRRSQRARRHAAATDARGGHEARADLPRPGRQDPGPLADRGRLQRRLVLEDDLPGRRSAWRRR